jgi:hypothetical protein
MGLQVLAFILALGIVVSPNFSKLDVAYLHHTPTS